MRLLYVLGFAGLLAGVGGVAGAAAAAGPADEEELRRRLKELEDRIAAITATFPAEAAPNAPPDPESARESLLQFRLYPSVDFRASDFPGERSSFALGQADVFLTARLSGTFSGLAEAVLEADTRNEFTFDLERLLLSWTPVEWFHVSAGRFHTALGYYNTAFHHGAIFQAAAVRPQLFAFEDEGGILPLHLVGLSATGAVPSGKLGLRYVAEIGNGRARDRTVVQNVSDENNSKAVNLGLLARPEWVPSLQLGLSYYRDRLGSDEPGADGTTEEVWVGHAVYETLSVEWLNEVVTLRRTPGGDRPVAKVFAFYSQLAVEVGRFRPFARFEYIDSSDDLGVFGVPSIRRIGSVGARFEVGTFAVLKAQVDRHWVSGSENGTRLTLQTAFAF